MIVTDLDKLSREVTHEHEDHESVLEQLRAAHKKHGGYGIAANQIGVYNSRTCLVDVREKIPLINPRIVDREGETTTLEGCLSIPNTRVRTRRNVWVTVEADNFEGQLSFGPPQWTEEDEANEEKKKKNSHYIESIAVQHELGHLNGLTIFDSEIERQPYEKSKLESLGRNDKVRVENADGEEFEVKWKHASKHDDWTVLDIV